MALALTMAWAHARALGVSEQASFAGPDPAMIANLSFGRMVGLWNDGAFLCF